MEKLSKRALKCMYAATVIGSVVGVAVLAAVYLLWLKPDDILAGKIVTAVLGILLVLNAAVSPYFRFHRYRYDINDEFIDIREGYIFVERSIVPLERLHKMQTIRGPIDRFFKVAKVIVTTAGGDVTIRFLDEEKAERIAENLGKRINQIVAEKREEDGK